jgi:hypothetical protein
MRKFSFGLMGMAFAVAAMGMPIAAPSHGENPSDAFKPSKRGKGRNNRRGKGKIAKPQRKSNRLTISKHVRRKHRRAA